MQNSYWMMNQRRKEFEKLSMPSPHLSLNLKKVVVRTSNGISYGTSNANDFLQIILNYFLFLFLFYIGSRESQRGVSFCKIDVCWGPA